MSPKRSSEEKSEPSLSATKAVELFKRQIDQIGQLERLNYDDPEREKWNNFTEQLIIRAFGKPHENLNHFYHARRGGPIHGNMRGDEKQRNYLNGLKNSGKLLEGFIDQLQLFPADDADYPRPTLHSRIRSQPSSNKIFIVHGHDHNVLTELSLILTRLGLEPIILYEQPSEGKTLIEKLEKYSDVGFAFILLTPDDIGRGVGETRDKPRARQNVVLEFGLFVGKLGRERCCALYTGDLELPSDLHGLIYLPFKSKVAEIELRIVTELRAAGYQISI